MPITRTRIRRLEDEFGRAGEDSVCGKMVVLAPNAWPDADREAWEHAEILHDHEDLIARNTGVRPQRCRQHVRSVIVLAPDEIEQADEATRAAWCAMHMRPWWTPDREKERSSHDAWQPHQKA